ncbi:MAG TPA: dipeptide epimerase [Ignavibacteriaceae bacterium]|nr:dipeptide epimerase [Ignavibacteriaceae bacterium]
MKLNFYPYTINLKEQFNISLSSRTTTPAVMVEVEHNGLIGYGEASLPPYLSEDQSSVISFLKKLNLNSFNDPANINSIMDYVDSISEGNNAAKASVDIALHDLLGKYLNLPLYKYLGIEIKDNICSSYTIGITDLKKIKQRVDVALEFKFLKIKLGTLNDKVIVSTIRKHTDKPLFVDVNQGWSDKYFALDMISWLSEQNVILIEQPLPKENFEDSKWLMERSLLPIIADEAVQTINDLEKIKHLYSGVNIKLMKAGGIRQAYRMMQRAKELNLKIMLGCMTETSCAITAASHLSPLADWVDLDGAELISNDLFTGMKIKNGALIIPDMPGLGVEKITK